MTSYMYISLFRTRVSTHTHRERAGQCVQQIVCVCVGECARVSCSTNILTTFFFLILLLREAWLVIYIKIMRDFNILESVSVFIHYEANVQKSKVPTKHIICRTKLSENIGSNTCSLDFRTSKHPVPSLHLVENLVNVSLSAIKRNLVTCTLYLVNLTFFLENHWYLHGTPVYHFTRTKLQVILWIWWQIIPYISRKFSNEMNYLIELRDKLPKFPAE